jgi:predicted PurR-regulated permease PerM
LVKRGSETFIASIRIAILVAVLHHATQASWQKLSVIASFVVLGILIAPHLIGHRAPLHPFLRARP